MRTKWFGIGRKATLQSFGFTRGELGEHENLGNVLLGRTWVLVRSFLILLELMVRTHMQLYLVVNL